MRGRLIDHGNETQVSEIERLRLVLGLPEGNKVFPPIHLGRPDSLLLEAINRRHPPMDRPQIVVQ
jgi:hypothetical protein